MNRRKTVAAVAVAVFLCLSFTIAQAAPRSMTLAGQVRTEGMTKAVPGQLSYQGYLVSATDSLAITATLELTFRLYDSESKGAELWSETHPAVEVNDGLFQVFLGSVTPFPDGLFDGTPLWLQTEVGPEILAPRRPLVSTAYSHRANSAEMLLDYTLTDLDGRWVNEEDLDHLNAADGSPGNAVYVDPTGQVGIGTQTPAYRLDVSGEVSATAYHGDGSNLTGISGTADNDWTIDGDNIYHQNGPVGIGTSSPTAPLTIQAIAGDEIFFPGSGNNIDVKAQGEFRIGTQSTSPLHLLTENNFRLTVMAGDGNVGIGTTLPYERLHLHDNAKGSCYTQFTNSSTGSGSTDGFLVGINTDGNAFIYNRETMAGLNLGTDNTTRLYIDNTGEVGIGTTTPAHELEVVGAVGATTYYGDGSNLTGIAGSPDSDWTVSGNHMYAAVPGSVGIGTTDPLIKLHVVGNIGSTEDIYSGDDFLSNLGRGQLGTGSSHGNGYANWYSPNDNELGLCGYLSGTNGLYGGVWIYLDGNERGYWFVDYDKGGDFVLTDSTGSTTIYCDGSDGTITTKKILSATPHPLDPDKEIVYCCLEGPEAAAYVRGSAQLVGGQAEVSLEDHFSQIVNPSTVTVQLTPLSAESRGLAVIEKSAAGFKVKELSSGQGNYRFDYFVQGVKRGDEKHKVVRARRTPGKPGSND